MWEKIKAFFQKKPVVITEGAVIAAASIGLFIGGFNATEIVPKVTTVAVAAVVAVEALITVIQGITKK